MERRKNEGTREAQKLVQNTRLESVRAKFYRYPSITSAILLALAVRLLLLPWFSDSLNFYGYKLTTSLFLQGRDPWLGIASDPALAQLNPWGYPPPFLLVTSIASILSFGNGYVFGVLIRLPGVAADIFTGLFLFRIGLASGLVERNAKMMAIAYLFNPFAILVCSIWGTIDPIPVMFVTVGVFYLIRTPRSPDLAAFLFGIGIAFKLYPLIFVPIGIATLPRLLAKIRFVILSITPFIVTSLPAIIYSSHQYFSVLTGFTTGIASNGLGLYLSLWWLLQIGGVQITASALLLEELLYFLIIFVLSWMVLKNNLSFVRASTIATLALYLAAPRLNENYFLWAVPFTLIVCYIERWSTGGRIILQLAWVPFGLSALLFNGVTGEAVGLGYWGLVSFGRTLSGFGFLPNWIRPSLVASFLVILATALVLLVKHQAAPKTFSRSLKAKLHSPRGITFGLGRTLPIFTTLVLVFLLSTSAVNWYHHDVLPEDFGAYVLQSSRVVTTDNFNSLLLGPTWQFGGTGKVTLPATGILLDTVTTTGTAWISRLIPNEAFQLSIVLTISRFYGSSGSLVLLRVPGGWLGAERALPPRNLTLLSLTYFDEVTAQKYILGTISLGASFNSSLQVSSTTTTISLNQTTVSTSGRSPIEKIQFGQTDATSSGGGEIMLNELNLSWPILADPFLFWFAPATLAFTTTILIAPIIWSRSQRRRPKTGAIKQPMVPRPSPNEYTKSARLPATQTRGI